MKLKLQRKVILFPYIVYKLLVANCPKQRWLDFTLSFRGIVDWISRQSYCCPYSARTLVYPFCSGSRKFQWLREIPRVRFNMYFERVKQSTFPEISFFAVKVSDITQLVRIVCALHALYTKSGCEAPFVRVWFPRKKRRVRKNDVCVNKCSANYSRMCASRV